MTARRFSLWCTAVLCAVVFGAGVAGCGDDGEGEADAAPGVDLALDTIDGTETVTLGAPSTRPRVVNLWATWCAPCRRELPDFDLVARDATDSVEVIGVNIGEDAEVAAGLVDELGLGFVQLHDPDAVLSEQLGVVNMPSTAFLASDGTVTHVYAGALSAEELVELIDEHLGITL